MGTGKLDQEQVLASVRATWQNYKDKTRASQSKVAKSLGMNQSAFSQYLRGPSDGGIPLNEDFLVKFGKVTGADLESFGIEKFNDVRIKAIALPVRGTLSGRVFTDRRVTVDTVVPDTGCYLVEVDFESHPLRKGTYILVDSSSAPREGEDVIYYNGERFVLGQLMFDEGVWEVIEQHWAGARRFVVDVTDDLKRVAGTYRPETDGELFGAS